MSMFKKRGPDIIDLTKLQEKGILQKSIRISKMNEESGLNDGKFVDLGTASSSSSGDSGGMFGFLDNLASAGASSGSRVHEEENVSSLEVQGLKNKIEDLEYKLDRLIERIDKVESKASS